MNRGVAENEFRAGIEELLADIGREAIPGSTNPYAGAGESAFHEHDTRVFFFDRLMRLLGWELGQGGNVAEEARIRGESTNFVDYVGVNRDTRAPALILEAKSWEKPSITGKGKWRGRAPSELVVAAVRHINAGGTKEKSPVTGEWHENLSQVARYVRLFKDEYRHEVPRAVLSSGRWLLIFKTPVVTFCDHEVNDGQICLLHVDSYVADANVILEHMSRVMLADTAPARIRSSQLGNYVSPMTLRGAYYALLVRYEKSGAAIFDRMPRILVYPALIVERSDKALFTVIDSEQPIEVLLSAAGDDVRALEPHLAGVFEVAEMLRASCAAELGIEIAPDALGGFGGFSATTTLSPGGIAIRRPRKYLVRTLPEGADHWFVLTGKLTHFLRRAPEVDCRFHTWASSRAEGAAIGVNAVNSPHTNAPRAFFTDGMSHHCAHQIVDHRKSLRCHIQAIDGRLCCRACVFQDDCWTEQELAALPCGK